MKVRNRLDRRIYAVKKVVLQPENGKWEKVGKLENAKLMREVTTISRMTHKNIVRYYQAWVDGGEDQDEIDDQNEAIDEKSESLNSEESTSNNESNSSESEKKGFWIASLDGDDSNASSSSWSEDDGETAVTPENLDDFDFMRSPLMVGFGSKNKAGTYVMEQYRKSSTSESDNPFDESESELDTSEAKKRYNGSKRMLYIQMEYCTSSLRRLIDDNSLQNVEQDDIWKLVRQILEALEYIHKVRYHYLDHFKMKYH